MAENAPEIHPVSPHAPTAAKRSLRKWLYFAFGFIGWYIVNGLVWSSMPNSLYEHPNFLNLAILMLPLNLIALLILALVRKTRWIGFGMLSAIAINLGISVLMGLFTRAVCMIPFYINN